MCGAATFPRVQHREQAVQPRTDIGAVRNRAVFEIREKTLPLEDARVVGEQTEHDSHQEAVKVFAHVTGCAQLIVDHADQFGGLNVDRILLAERAPVHAHHEAETFDLLGQLGQREADVLLDLEVDQLPVLKVAEQ